MGEKMDRAPEQTNNAGLTYLICGINYSPFKERAETLS